MRGYTGFGVRLFERYYMTYNGIAWPGLDLSIKAINRERIKIQRWLRSLDENPKHYKRPTLYRTKWKAMLADLDTGLSVLRAAEKAARTPTKPKRRGRRLNELDPGPAIG